MARSVTGSPTHSITSSEASAVSPAHDQPVGRAVAATASPNNSTRSAIVTTIDSDLARATRVYSGSCVSRLVLASGRSWRRTRSIGNSVASAKAVATQTSPAMATGHHLSSTCGSFPRPSTRPD
jgi:hypothetical protein